MGKNLECASLVTRVEMSSAEGEVKFMPLANPPPQYWEAQKVSTR